MEEEHGKMRNYLSLSFTALLEMYWTHTNISFQSLQKGSTPSVGYHISRQKEPGLPVART